jgi:D-sedoheptulose 7-phosphate isomerase
MASSSDLADETPFGRHLGSLHEALDCLERESARLQRWGTHLADVLLDGGRLLAVGNGGSAAHAAHFTSELVGRYRCDRPPMAALALGAESSALTAIANDWRFEDVFARQVHAFGRPGDVLFAFSTSGRSPNVLAAVEAAHEVGMVSWAATGAAPNPLLGAAHDGIAVPAASTATVQEVHQVAIHLLCESVDARVQEVVR